MSKIRKKVNVNAISPVLLGWYSRYLDFLGKGEALVYTMVSKKMYVYGAYFRLTSTEWSPVFNCHRSALSPLIVKIESSISPKLNIWFSNDVPCIKLFTIFTMQSHEGNIKKCNFITHFLSCLPIVLQSKSHTAHTKANDKKKHIS